MECTDEILTVALAKVTCQMPLKKCLAENADLTFILQSLIFTLYYILVKCREIVLLDFCCTFVALVVFISYIIDYQLHK